MARVFIYGSLLSGESNHHVLHGAVLIGPATTSAGIGLVIAGPYPSLVIQGRSHRTDLATSCVVGELYEVDGPLLDAVDRFEGHPEYFERLTVALDDGTSVFAYALAPRETETLPLVAGGSYRQRSEKKRGPNPSGA